MPRPEQFKAGDTVSDCYTVLAKIGEGGMGVVYKVQHTSINRTCALKTIEAHGDQASQQAVWQRFQKEARTISKLVHRSIIKVYDFGITDSGTAYYVMDFVEGQTLHQVMRKQGQLDMRQAVGIFIQVAQGLAYAHSQKVAHLDIKPSNIMLVENPGGNDDREVRIIDFGLAEKGGRNGGGGPGGGSGKTGDHGEAGLGSALKILGSPPYMSPEQFQNGALDYRSDVYSFGCSLYEALTGVPPFISDSAMVLSMKHVSEPPPRLDQASLGREFPAELEMIVARLLAKDPRDRYQDMSVVAEDLQGVLDNFRQTSRSKAAKRSAAPWSEISKSADTLADSQNITVSQLPQATLMRILTFAGGFLLVSACVALAVCATFQSKPQPKVARQQATAPSDTPGGEAKEAAVVPKSAAASSPTTHPSSTTPSLASALADSTSPSITPASTIASAQSHSTGAATDTATSTTSQTAVATTGNGANSKEPFAKIAVGKNGRKMRVFSFPKGIRLGRFVARDLPPSLGWEAEGQVAIDIEHKLQFVASPICCQSPSYFRRFAPDDLCELDLVKDDSVTSEILTYIDHLTGLQRLCLLETEVDDDCIPVISTLPRLDWLDVSETNISGAGLAKLKQLKQLTGLRYGQLKNTGPLLLALKDSPNIKDLHADGTILTTKDLKIIVGLKHLNFLSINNTGIGLQGLEILSQAPSLEELMIASDAFGPDVIPILKKFHKLKDLKINCDNWSAPQIHALKTALPSVKLNICERVED